VSRERSAPLTDDTVPLPTDNVLPPAAARTGNGLGIEMARKSKFRLFNPDRIIAATAPLPTDDKAASAGTGFRMAIMPRRSDITSLTLAAHAATRNRITLWTLG